MYNPLRVFGIVIGAALLSGCAILTPQAVDETTVAPSAQGASRALETATHPSKAAAVDLYFKPIAGYRQDLLPAATMSAMRERVAESLATRDAAAAKEAISDFTARFVYQGSRLIGIVVVFAIDPTYVPVFSAELEHAASGFFGKEYTAVRLGSRDAFSGNANSMPALLWLQNGMLIMIGGADAQAIQNYAATAIEANKDAVAPRTTITNRGASGDGWSRDDFVTLNVTSSDGAGSGVAEISYRAHGAHTEEGELGQDGTITIRNEGVTDLEIAAEDLDGNVESTQRITAKLDRTAPVVTLRGVRHYAIYESVSVTCNASDALSGIVDECRGAATNAVNLGFGSHTITRTVTDRAGNATTATITYSVDLTTDVVVAGAMAVVFAGAAILFTLRRRTQPLRTPEPQTAIP